MDFRELVFVDTETTGLDPVRDQIWEVTAIKIHPLAEVPADPANAWFVDHNLLVKTWYLQIDIFKVDDWVRENTRITKVYDPWKCVPVEQFIREFASFVDGRHMVGAVISFDAERIGKLFWEHNEPVPWHYHIIDVEAVAVGATGAVLQLPWDSQELSRTISVQPPSKEEAHDSFHDALWAYRMLAGSISHEPNPNYRRVR